MFRLREKEHIDIWNELYCTVDSSITNKVLTSEEFYIIDDFKLLESDAKILEAGCRDGRWVKALHDKGIKVYGIDFAIAGLQSLKRNTRDALIVQGDVKYLPFRNEAFSLILSLGVLEHFEDLKDIDIALKEAYRCLKPGGHLLVTVPYLSWNRQFNPQVVARRLASRINWLRKIFNKGEKLFFQYEFSKKYFRNKLLLNNFSIIYEELIWLDLGLKDDFRGLYPLLKRIIYAYHHISYLYLKNIIKKLFAAFMLFLCIKQQSG